MQTNNVEYAAAKPPAAHSDSETPERASVVTTEPPGSAAGKVDAVDLSLLMARMGQYYPPADLNSDGIVSQADVSYLQGAWTW
ncbi:MAG TPA: hypothetical protein VK978_04585 [Candidatus Saccharimonadales bacterium]|nr:hypothetical protein [Candidatus Saccharimonadales bacterium]